MNAYRLHDDADGGAGMLVAAGLSDDKRATLAYALKDTLQGFVGQRQEAMEGLNSNVRKPVESVDELKHKLYSTAFELESHKEEMRREKEIYKQLLLRFMTERDAAIAQLQALLNPITQQEIPAETAVAAEHYLVAPCHDKPQMRAMRANSSSTDSDSFSTTPRMNHSYGGDSPMDSILDPASSPDPLSSFSMPNSSNSMMDQQFLMDYCEPEPIMGVTMPAPEEQEDPAFQAVFSRCSKSLPEKGKLMQAVIDAGPLLNDLLIAGQLPTWRNPPPLQPFNLPRAPPKGQFQPTFIVDASSYAMLPPPPPPTDTFYNNKFAGGLQFCSSASVANFSNAVPAVLSDRRSPLASSLPSGCGGYPSGSIAKRLRSQ